MSRVFSDCTGGFTSFIFDNYNYLKSIFRDREIIENFRDE